MQAGGCLTRGSLRAILLRIVLLKGLVVHALPTAAAVLIASLVCQGAALSQESYPSKPLRIIVPYAAGGGIDILGRTIGQQLAERWKQPAVVDNKPGASGAIGTELAARAAPDGYTLLMSVNTMVIVPSMGKKVPYDPVRDFAPVAPVALGSMALVVPASTNIRSVADLIAAARQAPGKLNYASPGSGTPHHLDMELLKQRAGISLVHVPYKGSDGMLTAALSGQIDAAFIPIHQALPGVQAGKLIMLSSGGSRRSIATPSVPSLSEAAHIDDIDVDVWYGLYLPAGTPAAIVEKLNAEVNAILKLPQVVAALERQGLVATGGTPEELATLTRTDGERWAKVIREAKLAEQ